MNKANASYLKKLQTVKNTHRLALIQEEFLAETVTIEKRTSEIPSAIARVNARKAYLAEIDAKIAEARKA